jgi:hypothetical protein
MGGPIKYNHPPLVPLDTPEKLLAAGYTVPEEWDSLQVAKDGEVVAELRPESRTIATPFFEIRGVTRECLQNLGAIDSARLPHLWHRRKGQPLSPELGEVGLRIPGHPYPVIDGFLVRAFQGEDAPGNSAVNHTVSTGTGRIRSKRLIQKIINMLTDEPGNPGIVNRDGPWTVQMKPFESDPDEGSVALKEGVSRAPVFVKGE